MKLSTKIAAGMGCLAVLMGILGGYLLMQMAQINDSFTLVTNQMLPVRANANNIDKAATEYRLAEVLHLYAPEPAQMKEYEKRQEKWKEVIDNGIRNLEGLIFRPEVKQVFQTYLAVRQTYQDTHQRLLELSRQNRMQEAVAVLNGDSRTQYDEMNEKLKQLVGSINGAIDKANAAGDVIYDTARLIGIILVVAAVLIAVLLTLLLVRNTLRQLGKDPGELNTLAHRVVDGDYNVDDGGKKVGVYGAIVEMVNALKTHIENARRESENAKEQSAKAQEAMQQAEAAGKEAQAKTEAMLVAADKLETVGNIVSSASAELSAQIEQSDRGAAESASRLSEAATAMNEMNATVQEVAKNAGSASAASAETREKAEAGSRVVEKTVHNIEEVHQLSLTLKDDMTQLNEHAQDITRIMGVISDIADQTNLLALNAAIEAARAGEAGRGFAVVADEVRKLAEKTMASTQDVGNAIRSIQESTAQSMSAVDEAVQRIGEATELANQSGQALQEIVETVEATADQVNAIATASEEQSAASEEINQSIVQVNDMSKQTAEAMAEAARAVSDLAAQAQGLTDLIQDLKQA